MPAAQALPEKVKKKREKKQEPIWPNRFSGYGYVP